MTIDDVKKPNAFSRPWAAMLIIGLATVLVSHLGLMPLDTGDEARRALVSLEMILSGDFITPTLHGERYFNKPPLYNWLIIGSYKLFGNYSSFALRFPMLVSLFAFGLTIFSLVRRYTNQTLALATTLMVLSSGRVLLYDSMLGLIEITFAWVSYWAMMLIYHFDQQRRYWLLYLSTYTLTAVAFLLKGLPPVAFLGCTLFAWFGFTHRWRLLIHPAHLGGIVVFLLLTGSYYWAYFSRNAIPYSDLASVLLKESTKRTGLTQGLGATLLHLVTFPAELIYHFVPYTLLIGLLFRRDIKRLIQINSFILFNAITFLATVWIYWVSPQVYGRYLIGLIPLLFTVLSWLYYEHTTPVTPVRYWVERLWLAATTIVAIGCWVTVLYPATRTLPFVIEKTVAVSASLFILAWYMYQPSYNRLGLIAAALIVIRLGFNWFVLPGRATKRQFYQDSAVQAAKLTLGHPLYSYGSTLGADNATDVSTFHITATRQDILRKTTRHISGAYYIGDSVTLANQTNYQSLTRLVIFDRHPATIIKFDLKSTNAQNGLVNRPSNKP